MTTKMTDFVNRIHDAECYLGELIGQLEDGTMTTELCDILPSLKLIHTIMADALDSLYE